MAVADEYKKTATYIDENGQKQTGKMAPDTTGMSVADLYKAAYENQAAQNAEQLAAANSETARLAEEQKQTAAEQYKAANQQLYSDYRHNVKNLPEQLAAYGINGGLSESSRVRLETGYTGGVNANEQARIAGERAIDSAATAQRYQAQLAADQANGNALSNYYAAVIGQRQQDDANALAQRQQTAQMLAAAGDYSGYVELGMMTPEQARQMKQKQDDANALPQRQQAAQMLAAAGDYSGYVELGMMTPEQAKQMQQAWIASNPELAVQMGYVQPKKSVSGTKKTETGDKPMEISWDDYYGKFNEQQKAQASVAAAAGTAVMVGDSRQALNKYLSRNQGSIEE